MQTIYTSSRSGLCRNKIIDLNEYRRSLEPAIPQEEPVYPLVWDREEERPRPKAHPALGLGAWMLDILASAGVVAMTAVFTLQIL